jgi:hypothetical protein
MRSVLSIGLLLLLFDQIVLFSPASSTTKTGRHDIAEIRLKVALKHQISNQI